MHARIVDGKVAERSPSPFKLGLGESAHCVEVGDDVLDGWLWSPTGCTPPIKSRPDPVEVANSYLLADAQTVQELSSALAAILNY